MKIIMIGFMGSGKSVVGEQLANKLGLSFIDMDNEIEKKVNLSINEIFQQYGEEYFRELESKLLEDLVERENIVISTGGGIITKKSNLDIIQKEKNVVFLDASIETIIKHTSKEVNKRPLLSDSNNIYNTIKSLLKGRYGYYKGVSKLIIDVNNKNIDEVISQILVSIR